MDFSSSPIWISDDGKQFINAELKDINLSDDLGIAFLNFKKAWLAINNELLAFEHNKKQIPETLFQLNNSLNKLPRVIAEELAEEFPENTIHYWDDKLTAYVEILVKR